jgi:hypothetical protein
MVFNFGQGGLGLVLRVHLGGLLARGIEQGWVREGDFEKTSEVRGSGTISAAGDQEDFGVNLRPTVGTGLQFYTDPRSGYR